jgi:hypothetical protein
VLCCEEALKYPGVRIAFFAPSQVHAEAIVGDQMQQLLHTAPDSLVPRWSTAEQAWLFQNNSRIEFYSGSVGIRRNLRGLRVHMSCVDEARDITQLQNLLDSTISPALQYAESGGFRLVTSTPPDEMDHDFVKLYFATPEHQRSMMTIDMNYALTREFIDQAVRDCGGRHTAAFRREYLCEFIPESEGLVLPSFEAALERIRKYVPRPPRAQRWAALDPGGVDPTASNGGWEDDDRVVVSSEWRTQGATLSDVAAGLRQVDVEACGRNVWIDKGNDILVRSLFQDHKIRIFPSPAPDLHGNVAQLLELIAADRFNVDPRCIETLDDCRSARWNDSGTGFRRNKRGHSDNLAACLVAIRSLKPQRDRTLDRREYHRDRMAGFVSRLEGVANRHGPLTATARRIRQRQSGPTWPAETVLRDRP